MPIFRRAQKFLPTFCRNSLKNGAYELIRMTDQKEKREEGEGKRGKEGREGTSLCYLVTEIYQGAKGLV